MKEVEQVECEILSDDGQFCGSLAWNIPHILVYDGTNGRVVQCIDDERLSGLLL